MRRMMLTVAALCALTLTSAAQQAPRFEVASVKPILGPSGTSRWDLLPSGRFVATNSACSGLTVNSTTAEKFAREQEVPRPVYVHWVRESIVKDVLARRPGKVPADGKGSVIAGGHQERIQQIVERQAEEILYRRYAGSHTSNNSYLTVNIPNHAYFDGSESGSDMAAREVAPLVVSIAVTVPERPGKSGIIAIVDGEDGLACTLHGWKRAQERTDFARSADELWIDTGPRSAPGWFGVVAKYVNPRVARTPLGRRARSEISSSSASSTKLATIDEPP